MRHLLAFPIAAALLALAACDAPRGVAPRAPAATARRHPRPPLPSDSGAPTLPNGPVLVDSTFELP